MSCILILNALRISHVSNYASTNDISLAMIGLSTCNLKRGKFTISGGTPQMNCFNIGTMNSSIFSGTLIKVLP